MNKYFVELSMYNTLIQLPIVKTNHTIEYRFISGFISRDFSEEILPWVAKINKLQRRYFSVSSIKTISNEKCCSSWIAAKRKEVREAILPSKTNTPVTVLLFAANNNNEKIKKARLAKM